ncbi:MAG: Tat pathway signal protein [Armatimonadetes bacterium]|nr:Tat pathway signal protein [Armatimonadota bacterium]
MKRLWHWTGPHPDWADDQLRRHYQDLASAGLECVLIEGDIDDREYEVAQSAGLETHTWMWTVNNPVEELLLDHPDWYQVNRNGISCAVEAPYVPYYRWICPNHPQGRRYIIEKAVTIAEHPRSASVHLDYVRFPDVVLPRGLWEKYGLDQTTELPQFDYCYCRHCLEKFSENYNTKALKPSELIKNVYWYQFRYQSISDLVSEIKREVSMRGKGVSAAVFPTPSLARKICRQSWSDWGLESIFPMLYQSFYLEGIDWIGHAVVEGVAESGSRIVAGLFLPALEGSGDLEAAVRSAMENGAAGVSLFGAPAPDQMKLCSDLLGEYAYNLEK